MKRLITLFLGIFALVLSAHAEVNFYKADSFAYKYVNDYGWTSWSDWEYSDILISIDYVKEIITVYSESEQRYIIMKYNDEYKDAQGGKQLEFTVVDQDGTVGAIRFRVQRDKTVQMYVEFSNIMWVYSGLKPM